MARKRKCQHLLGRNFASVKREAPQSSLCVSRLPGFRSTSGYVGQEIPRFARAQAFEDLQTAPRSKTLGSHHEHNRIDLFE
jgi:hypothetical protein